MASFEVSITDFIEIHPILSFAAWQFRASSIGAAPPRPIPGDGVEVSPVAKELPLGRMDWSRTDFWLAVGTGKKRSSTTTSPCTPYPLPSELQGDKVGKDYLLQNLRLDMRTGLSNGQAHSTLEKARFLAEKIQEID